MRSVADKIMKNTQHLQEAQVLHSVAAQRVSEGS